jgi:hypothetical protein
MQRLAAGERAHRIEEGVMRLSPRPSLAVLELCLTRVRYAFRSANVRSIDAIPTVGQSFLLVAPADSSIGDKVGLLGRLSLSWWTDAGSGDLG